MSSAERTAADRRQTIVMVRSALAIACAYLILFSEGSSGARGLGPLVIVVFLASNLVVGRMRPEVIGTQPFNVTIAVVDTALIAASLFLAGQLSAELVVLFVGILILAIAGQRFAVIVAATLGLSAAYVAMVWMAGESPAQSTVLLRVPFLLCAAMVYAWVTEAARNERSANDSQAMAEAGAMMADLRQQHEAIKRCQAALLEGSQSAARAALLEIAAENGKLQAMLMGTPAMEAADTATPALARGHA
jgi:hypothetical protein